MTQEQLNKPVNLGALQAATRKFKGKWDEEKTRIDGLYSDVSNKQNDLETMVTEVLGEVTAEGAAQVEAVRNVYQEDFGRLNSSLTDVSETVDAHDALIDETSKIATDNKARLHGYDFRKVDPFEGFVLEGDSQQNLETMVRNSEIDPYNGFMLDVSEVDPSDGFVLDGDRAQSLEGMVQDSDVYEQDAIMLSLEPVIPSASTHNFGIRGQIAIDNEYLYVCVADNSWKKIPLQNI